MFVFVVVVVVVVVAFDAAVVAVVCYITVGCYYLFLIARYLQGFGLGAADRQS